MALPLEILVSLTRDQTPVPAAAMEAQRPTTLNQGISLNLDHFEVTLCLIKCEIRLRFFCFVCLVFYGCLIQVPF